LCIRNMLRMHPCIPLILFAGLA
ncbi:hypothetical protein A2U01_0045044, partial [Trifolium medium]|nr:hypothetical protein [Trifolium medium]